MHFFLTQVVARIAAIYVGTLSYERLRQSYASREIEIAFALTNLIDYLFLNSQKFAAKRDDAPVRYWLYVGIEAASLLACAVVATFGWLPNA